MSFIFKFLYYILLEYSYPTLQILKLFKRKKLAFKMDIMREECDDPYHDVTFLFILSLCTE